MPARIRDKDVAEVLAAAGFDASDFHDGEWDPGYRCARSGTRKVHVFHDGPDEPTMLARYTNVLHEHHYQVVPEQQEHGGRRRLAVTRH